MRMKLTVAIIMMMAIAMAAPALPAPVVIKLSQSVEVPVTLTNTYTGEAIYGTTDASGSYVFDLSEFSKGWVPSALFKAEVLGISQEFRFSDPNVWLNFDIGTVYIPPAPPAKCVINKEIVADETVYVLNDECNVFVHAQPVTTKVCKIDASGVIGKDFRQIDNECDVLVKVPTDNSAFAATVVFVITLLGAGAYVRVYRPGTNYVTLKVVDGKLKHGHANYRTLHSTDTVHDYQPHTKGEEKPRYSTKKNAEGKYDYLG